MEEKVFVFLVLILGSVVVIAKPALEDAEDPGMPGKIFPIFKLCKTIIIGYAVEKSLCSSI